MIQDFIDEFHRYRVIAEKAMRQIGDDALNHVPIRDGNSIAMIVRHMSGNLKSRFTDFLSADGEKPWRQRDEEFVERPYTRDEVEAMWAEGWQVLESQLGALEPAHLSRQVSIRQVPLSVHEALCRASAHVAYHTGQIVLLARVLATGEWQWISIPKGQSEAYNRQPTLEKRPGPA